jgi:hypothetical protein
MTIAEAFVVLRLSSRQADGERRLFRLAGLLPCAWGNDSGEHNGRRVCARSRANSERCLLILDGLLEQREVPIYRM